MPTAYTPKHYREVIIKGYVIETAGKDKQFTFEKLVVALKKKDGGTTKDMKIAITTGNQVCLKGLQLHLEKVLGLPMDKWDTLVGKQLNINAKVILLSTKLDPDGFPEFVTHATKPTILLSNEPDAIFTDEEIEAMRPQGKAKAPAMPESAPVVNTGGEF